MRGVALASVRTISAISIQGRRFWPWISVREHSTWHESACVVQAALNRFDPCVRNNEACWILTMKVVLITSTQ